MSNNTKRLSFFAKIAQRSTALQSLLEEATGKSAVGAIAPDRQGQIGKRKEHTYYTTQRYEKDIALANTTPVSTESINPNLESRIKHVKEFYRGESVYFMKEVGIQRYPNHYHVAWTVPSAADGTLSATANGYPLFNGEAAIEGATIVFTATPASGKQLDSWSGLPDGATTAGNTATFTLAAEVNASVTFAEAAAVTSFMFYSVNDGESGSSGEQYIFTRNSSADSTKEDNPMYAWSSPKFPMLVFTETLSLTASMKCVDYDGTSLWVINESTGDWVNLSTPVNNISWNIIASIDPHMYQNIKVNETDGSTVCVMSRNPESDGYDTEDGKVLIAWYYDESTLYTKSLDIEVSSGEGEFDSTNLWMYDEESGKYVNITAEVQYAEILEVHEIQPLRFESTTAGATVHLTGGPNTLPAYVKYRTKTGETWGEWTDYTIGTTGAINMPCEFIADSWCVDGAEALGDGVTAYVSADAVVSGNITALWGRYGTLDNTIPEPEGNMLHHMRYLFRAGENSISDASNLVLADNTTAHCYDSMFYGCTSLTQASSLPARSLASYCYYLMFYGCTSLTQAPSLPVTTLVAHCYDSMFYGCTSLTQAPSLPATTLAETCYQSMFRGCTSLTEAPALPATTFASYCYLSMFQGCTSLTQAPSLPAKNLASYCYYQMFYGCTSLTEAPALPATTLASYCYHQMFRGCTSLTEAPALPATTLASACYYQMFQGCTSLTQAPELPATTLASSCYSNMFRGCTSLTEAPVLPATSGSAVCYESMFQGCTALTSSPRINIEVLDSNACMNMFNGCSSLNRVEINTLDHTASNCLYSWLAGVAATGDFYYNANVTTPYPTSSTSGIPSGWTGHVFEDAEITDLSPSPAPSSYE